jgi:hypothetical protein
MCKKGGGGMPQLRTRCGIIHVDILGLLNKLQRMSAGYHQQGMVCSRRTNDMTFDVGWAVITDVIAIAYLVMQGSDACWAISDALLAACALHEHVGWRTTRGLIPS